MDGLSVTHKEAIAIWEHNATRWPHLTPPWRPSEGDIAMYRKLCGSKLRGNILILGSTPELRDLVAQEQREHLPVLVDGSIAMLNTTTELLSRADPDNEIWIKSDWCSVPLENESFDLILGDMVWWVLSVQQQSRVQEKIAQLLKKDGLFISRFRMHNDALIDVSPSHIIEKYTRQVNNVKTERSVLRNALLSELYDATADRARKQISRKRVEESLLNAAVHTHDTHEQEFIHEAARSIVGADWTIQTRADILDALECTFNLLAEERAEDYDATFYPVLAFARKDSYG